VQIIEKESDFFGEMRIFTTFALKPNSVCSNRRSPSIATVRGLH
jgi:hypothetical protein